MRPQTRRGAIRVSVSRHRERRERDEGGTSGHAMSRGRKRGPDRMGRIPDLYVPVISLAIEIPRGEHELRARAICAADPGRFTNI